MKVLVSLLLFLSLTYRSLCQEFSDNSLFVGTGIGFVNNSTRDGSGLLHGLGYQTSIWNNRLRLAPQFTWGAMHNPGSTRFPDVYFYSRSIKIDINFDVLKVRTFTTFIGTGITGNLTSGITGLSGPDYFRETHFGLNGTLGFRLYS